MADLLRDQRRRAGVREDEKVDKIWLQKNSSVPPLWHLCLLIFYHGSSPVLMSLGTAKIWQQTVYKRIVCLDSRSRMSVAQLEIHNMQSE